jgi:ribosomal protein S18 acetylase RimI-like enzyme
VGWAGGIIPVMSDLDRMTASLVASWRALAAGAPGATVVRAGGADAAIFPAGPSREVFNNALLDRGGADPAATLRALEETYRAAGVARFAAWAHADDAAARAACAAAGYRPAERTCAMVARLGGVGASGAAGAGAAGSGAAGATGPAGPAGVSPVVRLDDPREAVELNGVGADLLDRWPADARWYGVRDGAGRLVSTALALQLGDDCQISFVATAPAARRRGHASRVLAQLLADAAAAGCATGSLQSTPEAERLYAAAGFAEVGRFVEHEPPAS